MYFCIQIKGNIMSIKDYRLTSMEEPSDDILMEFMEQVADSARKSSANASRVLEEMMQATIAKIHENRRLLLS